MKIGMLWGMEKISGILDAKKYHLNKYGILPDIFEINPVFAEKIGLNVKEKTYEDMRFILSKNTTVGTILIGLNNDSEGFKYSQREKTWTMLQINTQD